MKAPSCGWRLLWILVALSPGSSPTAPAATVASCDETSLRAALAAGGTVTFACEGTIVVTERIPITTTTQLDASGRSVVISGNRAAGIFVVNPGVKFILVNVTIAEGRFSALLNYGELSALNCTFAGNTSDRYGGAVNNLGVGRFTGCTFLTNSAVIWGGALGVQAGLDWPLFVTNCTFVGNAAPQGTALGTIGISSNWVVNCTIADRVGMALGNHHTGRLFARNTIIANSTGSSGVGVTDAGHNITADANSSFTDPTTLNGIDPRLGPLGNYGGPTLTLLPLADSPAVEGAGLTDWPLTDQRGIARPVGAASDAGAVELEVSETLPGLLRFLRPVVNVQENVPSVVIPVVRVGGSAGSIQVEFATRDGSAVAGLHYLPTSGALTFAPGQLSNAFSVVLLDNAIVDSDKTVQLALANPTPGAQLALYTNATLRIHNDDATFSFSAQNYDAGESSGLVPITVTRQGNTNGVGSVGFATSNYTATAGSDYLPTNGVLVFAPGETTRSFSVALLTDVGVEGPETLELTLFEPENAALGAPAEASLTITDDDLAVTACEEASLRTAIGQAATVYLACDGVIPFAATLDITRDVILDGSGHQVTLSGGGAVRVFTVAPGVRLTLKNLTVSDGLGGLAGGGILNQGSLRLLNCTFRDNTAIGSQGTGGAISHGTGSLEVAGCVFLNNRALSTNSFTSFGGAIGGLSATGPMLVSNSTFFGNSAGAFGGVARLCIGTPNSSPGFIVNCTLASNLNGAIINSCLTPFAGDLTLRNTLLAAGTGPNLSGVIDGGHNLSSDGSGGFTHPFSLENVDPRLGTLADHGGPTLCLLPSPDSPAIDGGKDGTSPPVDQRGLPRPSGAFVDIGAVESTVPGTNPGYFQILAATNTVWEGQTDITFMVARAGGVAGEAAVQFAAQSGTATAGADFHATNGFLNFAAGERSQTFTVRLADDTEVEDAETFAAVLSNPTGGAALGRSAATVTLQDNDVAVQFSAGDYTAGENTSTAIITLTRAGATNLPMTVKFKTSDGTAAAGSDYRPANGVVQFAAGQTNATISIQIQDDFVPEASETFALVLFEPGGGASLGTPAVVTITLLDDDPIQPGTLQIASAGLSVAEGDAALISVVRTGGTNGMVAVSFATSDLTAAAGADYSATNGTLSFGDTEVRKWFLVPTAGDALAEGAEAFRVTLNDPTGGATIGGTAAATTTLVDGERILSVCDEASLRDAVHAGGRVILACNGVIALSQALVVSNGTRLDATGSEVTLSGGQTSRLFSIQAGVELTLRHLTLQDGGARGATGLTNGAPGGPGEGGAVHNNGGVLIAEQSRFLSNQAMGGNGGPISFPSPGQASPGGVGNGGAIFSLGGHVWADHCLFAYNRATGGRGGIGAAFALGGEAAGGAIYNSNGVVQLVACSALGNGALSGQHRRLGGIGGSAAAYGGAVFNAGDLLVHDGGFWLNSVQAEYLNDASGGGVYHRAGTLRMMNSTLADNRALGGRGLVIGTPFGLPGRHAYGGAVTIAEGQGLITNSTVARNVALGGGGTPAGTGSGFGGGIYSGGNVTLWNCTVGENSALGGTPGFLGFPPGSGYGGGVCNQGGVATLTHVTLSSNTARMSPEGSVGSGASLGGGLFSRDGSLTLRNTLVANSPSGSNCFGETFVYEGNNLSSDASGDFTAPGSFRDTDPRLGPLADYGGPTATVALLASSPAIDAAHPQACAATDQRGRPRPFGAACDIGAFEATPPYTIVGRLTGFVPPPGATVRAGTSIAPVGSTGVYALHGFSVGQYLLKPESPTTVCVPKTRLVSVAADTVGIDFQSYLTNAIVIGQTPPVVHAVFAGEAGASYSVQLSVGLPPVWVPYSTQPADAEGLLHWAETNVSAPSGRFFRVLRP